MPASSAAFLHRMETLCRSDMDERALRVSLLDAIRREVPFDNYAWLLTDPQTWVGYGPVAEVPSLTELPRLIRLKYLTEVNRWTTLRQPFVRSLLDATEGHPDRSRVWRDVLTRFAVVDVVSVVLRDRFGCWGFLDLWRSGPGKRPFDRGETQMLEAITTEVTRALRQRQADALELPHSSSSGATGSHVLLLSADLELKALTPDAERSLMTLLPPTGGIGPIPAHAYNVAAQLLAREEGIDDNPPVSRVHVSDGVFVTFRASRMPPARAGSHRRSDIAVAIEPTAPFDRLELFVRALGLTDRESEVVRQLAGGGDTRTVAERLFISESTVQDHLKAVFAKSGTHSRRTVVARALGT